MMWYNKHFKWLLEEEKKTAYTSRKILKHVIKLTMGYMIGYGNYYTLCYGL